MPVAMWKSACGHDSPGTLTGARECSTCGRGKEFAGWHLRMHELMARYQYVYRVKPIGLHRKLADQVLGALRGQCEDCGGEGVITLSPERWRGCAACEGTGGFWTCSEDDLEAALATVLERYPDAAAPQAPHNFIGGAVAHYLGTGEMVDVSRESPLSPVASNVGPARYGLEPGESRSFERGSLPDLPPTGVRFLRDGTLAVGTARQIEIWDPATGRRASAIPRPEGWRVLDLWETIPGAEEAYLLDSRAGCLLLVDRAGRELSCLELPEDARAFFGSETPEGFHEAYSVATDLAIAPSGDAAAVAYGQRYVLVWDLGRGELRRAIGVESSPGARRIYRVRWSADGARLLTGHTSGRLHVWDVATGKGITCFEVDVAPGRTAVDSPDDTPTDTSTFRGLGAFDFTPDSRGVAASDGASIRVWDIASGRELATWSGHGTRHPILGEYDGMPRIHDLRFSTNGRRALTVGVDSTLRVWDVASGAQIWGVRPDPCCLDHGDISPDGSHVAWVGCPGMRLYRLD